MIIISFEFDNTAFSTGKKKYLSDVKNKQARKNISSEDEKYILEPSSLQLKSFSVEQHEKSF